MASNVNVLSTLASSAVFVNAKPPQCAVLLVMVQYNVLGLTLLARVARL
jgi:hypothetical protein